MAPGRACYILAILLATVDIQPGGCVHIIASAEREGKQLKLICTLWHTKEEAEGLVVFLCKDKSLHCSPETSLRQLRLQREPEIGDRSEMSSRLVFTIRQVMPSDSGTYQCCASSQKPDMKFQGHFFSVHVSETGNYTVKGLKQRQEPEFHYNKGSLSTGFLQEKVWMLLLTSLVVPPALQQGGTWGCLLPRSRQYLMAWDYNRRFSQQDTTHITCSCFPRPLLQSCGPITHTTRERPASM